MSPEISLSKENIIWNAMGISRLDTRPPLQILLSVLSLLYKASNDLSCMSLTEITPLTTCSMDQIQISGEF